MSTPELALNVRTSKTRNQWVDTIVRMLKEKHLATFGLFIVLLLAFTAIFADIISPYPRDKMDLGNPLQGPSWAHLFGTDQIGRDLLSRVIHGARISMTVGLVGSVYATILSTLIGLISGYFGGKTDTAIQRFVDSWMSFLSLIHI